MRRGCWRDEHEQTPFCVNVLLPDTPVRFCVFPDLRSYGALSGNTRLCHLTIWCWNVCRPSVREPGVCVRNCTAVFKRRDYWHWSVALETLGPTFGHHIRGSNDLFSVRQDY